MTVRSFITWLILPLMIPVSIQSVSAQPSEVDIGLFKADSSTLEVRLKADGNFTKIVSNVAFTLRWKQFTGARLGNVQQTMPQQGYIPMSKSGSAHEVGQYRYQIFAGFGMNAIDQFNDDWQSGEEVVLMEIPVKDALGEFQIVNDTWTADVENNGDFYVSLNGTARTGTIYKGTVDFCKDLSLQTSHTNISCKNGNDGSASVSLTGQQSSFTANWSTGEENATITDLSAGSYRVTVSEDGCALRDTVTIDEPSYTLSSPTIIDEGDTLKGYHPKGSDVSFEWFHNGNLINTATDEILRIDKSGAYYLAVEDSNGCRKTSDTLSIDLTNIKDNDGQKQVLTVSPNPNEGLFTINVNPRSKGQSHLEIVNPLGKVLYDKKITGHFNEQLDFREMSDGVYLIKLKENDNEYVKKTVLQ